MMIHSRGVGEGCSAVQCAVQCSAVQCSSNEIKTHSMHTLRAWTAFSSRTYSETRFVIKRPTQTRDDWKQNPVTRGEESDGTAKQAEWKESQEFNGCLSYRAPGGLGALPVTVVAVWTCGMA